MRIFLSILRSIQCVVARKQHLKGERASRAVWSDRWRMRQDHGPPLEHFLRKLGQCSFETQDEPQKAPQDPGQNGKAAPMPSENMTRRSGVRTEYAITRTAAQMPSSRNAGKFDSATRRATTRGSDDARSNLTDELRLAFEGRCFFDIKKPTVEVATFGVIARQRTPAVLSARRAPVPAQRRTTTPKITVQRVQAGSSRAVKVCRRNHQPEGSERVNHCYQD